VGAIIYEASPNRNLGNPDFHGSRIKRSNLECRNSEESGTQEEEKKKRPASFFLSS